MRTKGKIASWNDDKGYGFITPLAGGQKLFVHVSALSNRNRRPELNEVITYSVSRDKQGRPCAANATLAGDKLIRRSPRSSNRTVLLLSVVFLAAIGLLGVTDNLSGILVIGYAGLSLIAFAAYAFDKSAAQRGAWRISEGTLLFLGLAGGWPGALIAQETLRHKSRKTPFRAAFWITVLMNCAALVWLHTDSGKMVVQRLEGNQHVGNKL